ncbi:MAG: Peptidase M50 [Parcubacteria group bacterium GW2011_GWB1_35_5]|nr:MAG: Peptidase M50 [Parcubacteria group bacterium GW2011_GWB1_35_5]
MDFIFIIIILIMSVVIHEVSHGYAALALGDPTAKYQGRLTLNPISHLDPIGSFFVPLIGYFAGGFIVGWAKPVPFNPYNLRNQRWGEALVAVAGPISNIALAILFGLTIRFLPEYINISQSFLNLASSVVLINIILAIFNLIPIPPLDGSKILFAFLPYKWQALRQSFERFGLILVFIFILFIWQIMSHIIGFIFTLLTGIAF